MKHRKQWLAAWILCAAAPVADAQTTFFGPWVDNASGVSEEFYVSPAGSNANPGIFPALPFRTITHALSVAGPKINAGIRVTLNIFPATYTEGTLNATACGLKVQTYNPTPGVASRTPRAMILGPGPSLDAIRIDSVGNPALPPTVLHGLDIGSGGLRIQPAGMNPPPPPPPPVPIGVTVRQCRIFDASTGIRIAVAAEWSERCVIEDNDIEAADSRFAVNGIFIANDGFSSTLVRSNRVFKFENNIRVRGASLAGLETRPRIVSNFTHLGQKNMLLDDCSPWVVNNSIAFAFFPVSTAGTVFGISHTGATLELHNNILWNPLAGSNATTATDLQSTGVVSASNNLIEDIGGFTPGFLGGDAHPGAAGPSDLHIGNSAAPIDAGNNAQAANLATPLTPDLTFTVNTMLLRRDVPVDVDLDPRIQLSTIASPFVVDIGADEITEVRLARVPNAANPILAMDDLGNVVPSAQGASNNDYTFSVAVTNNSSQVRAVVLMMGFGFVQDPVDFHFVLPWGNFRIDPDPIRSIVLSTTAVAPNSTVSIPVFLGGLPRSLVEAEMKLQAAVLDFTSGLGHNTNELRLEWND